MSNEVMEGSEHIQYWYGDKEAKARAWDIQYMKKYFPILNLSSLKIWDMVVWQLFIQ